MICARKSAIFFDFWQNYGIRLAYIVKKLYLCALFVCVGAKRWDESVIGIYIAVAYCGMGERKVGRREWFLGDVAGGLTGGACTRYRLDIDS